MSNPTSLCNRSIKTFVIFIKLADGDENRVEKVKKIIEDNFNLSQNKRDVKVE